MGLRRDERLTAALRWAIREIGGGARIIRTRSLREDRGPWLLQIERAGQASAAVLRVGAPSDLPGCVTEVAALLLAEEHHFPAPRLLAADLTGTVAGAIVVLSTRLDGTSAIPAEGPAERLYRFGAMAGTLHTIPLIPQADLPLRTRPIALDDFAAQRRATGTSLLFIRAEQRLAALSTPAEKTVFVHGDLWQGNSLWSGSICTGLIDWDSAGAGQPGLDLGSIRFDAAMMFGPRAAAAVLEGWQAATGWQPQALAYWDIVAALSTPPDIGAWLPAIHGQGRTDLDRATLWARRDAFLHSALDRSERHSTAQNA